MKKIVISLIVVLLVVGCGMVNSPKKEVENLLSNYQHLNKEVLKQLDEVVDSAGTMTEKQKEEYVKLMKKQYQNLNYKIVEENVVDKTATVQVEVEVFDYDKAIGQAETYLITNNEEFLNEEKEIDDEKFVDYKLEKMNDIKDKITYTINFTLTKKDNKWQIDEMTDIDRLKLHGLYS